VLIALLLDTRHTSGDVPSLMRHLTIIAVFVAVASVAQADNAPTPEEAAAIAQAKKLNEAAVAHFNLGEYPEAIAAWQQAYHLRPKAHIVLFNIAQCQRMLNDYTAAARSYRNFLREAKDLKPDEREVIQQRIADMDKAAAAELQKKPPTGTTPNETTPTPTSVAPVAPIVSAPVERRPWYKDPLGLSLGAGGIAVAVVGVGLLVHGNDLDSQLGHAPSVGQVPQLQSDRDTYRNAGFALIGVGAAATITGAIILGVRGARPSKKYAFICPVSGGMAATIGGSF
jgi:tetratricopeptide (TPR) repeat protein